MEHVSKNDIIKIVTKAGIVHVTDEHSLILVDGTIIKPKDLNTNHILMTHNYVYNYGNNYNNFTNRNKYNNSFKGEIIEIINLG